MKLYMYSGLIFILSLFNRFIYGAEVSGCKYDLNSMRVITCNTSACKSAMCVGYVVCERGDYLDLRQRVACSVDKEGKCPADPNDCVEDKSVTMKTAKYIYESDGNTNSFQGNNVNAE